jgi:hypothetical protein
VRTSKADRKCRGRGRVRQRKASAKGGARGAKNPNDPYYWRWLEFGWTPATGPRKGAAGRCPHAKSAGPDEKSGAAHKIASRGFMQAGADRLHAALDIFEAAHRQVDQ